ncbi:hypothetical protein GCM10012275_09070 [Longimycelium tulufanense]|uniref:CU044_5270 family protein n=1 Tax=Longimycelium tulufanense TaxID=907463 RepID=A0A8J3CAI6_9PSEU|nr:CU044_5270 family protein [Longimycelium tulufanense]GGM40329.1 hypothetical protein GCM10012275_09070 [Longimycelium tulufanense]
MSQRGHDALRRVSGQRLDPPPVVPPDLNLADTDEDTDPATVRPGNLWWKRPRTALVTAAAATVLVAGGAVFVAGDNTRPAGPVATPPPMTFQPASERNPAKLLHGLADRAVQQPAPRGEGNYYYVNKRQWRFSTSMGTDGEILSSGLVEETEELWRHPDGTGRMLRRWTGQVDGEDTTMDVPLSAIRRTPDETYHPQPGPKPPVGRDDAETLRERWLREGAGRTTSQWFTSATELWDARVKDPATAAALLRILADQPDITVDGTTTDRAGRRGISVSTLVHNNGPRDGYAKTERLHLVLDMDTGFPLATEQVVLEEPHLPVTPPATVSYTLWLAGAHVPDTQQRPQ